MNAPHSPQRLVPASDIISSRLSVREPADLIAYISHTLGFEPTRSWIGVSVRERRLGAVMRGDLLPTIEAAFTQGTVDHYEAERVEQDAHLLGRYIGAQLRHDAEADRMILICVLDGAESNGATGRLDPGVGSLREELGRVDRSIRQGAAQLGLPVYESWVVYERQIWHLYCGNIGSCLTQGTPIGESRGSLVSDSLTLLGQPLASPDETFDLPQPCDETAVSASVPHENDAVACWNWLHRWDEILDSWCSLDDDEAAKLVAPMGSSTWRDLLIVAACFGVDNAVSGLAHSSRVPDGLTELFGVSAHETCARLAAETLTGRTDIAPDWTRLDHLRDYCDVLVPRAARTSAAATAAMAAWIEWSRGRGTPASVLLEQALSWDSSCSLAALLAEAVRAGLINPWALDRDISWSSRDKSVA